MKKYLSILIAAAVIIFASCGGNAGETGSVVFKINPAALLASTVKSSARGAVTDEQPEIYVPETYSGRSVSAVYYYDRFDDDDSGISGITANTAFTFIDGENFVFTQNISVDKEKLNSILEGTGYSIESLLKQMGFDGQERATIMEGSYSMSGIDYKNCTISFTVKNFYGEQVNSSLIPDSTFTVTVKEGQFNFSETEAFFRNEEDDDKEEDMIFTYRDPDSCSILYSTDTDGGSDYPPEPEDKTSMMISIAIHGDVNDVKSVQVPDLFSSSVYVTFDGISVGSSIYAEALFYMASTDEGTTHLHPEFFGTSKRKSISAGANSVPLSLHRLEADCIWHDLPDSTGIDAFIEPAASDFTDSEKRNREKTYLLYNENEKPVSYGTYDAELNDDGSIKNLTLTEKFYLSAEETAYSLIKKPASQTLKLTDGSASFKSASGKTYTFNGNSQFPAEEPSNGIEACLPSSYADYEVAAWYTNCEYKEKTLAVFLFTDGTFIATKHKIEEDYSNTYEIERSGTYEILVGNTENGTANAYIGEKMTPIAFTDGLLEINGIEDTYKKQSRKLPEPVVISEPAQTAAITVELGTFNDTDLADYVTLSSDETSDMVIIAAASSSEITIKNWTVMLGDKKIEGETDDNTYTIPTGSLSTGIYNVTLTVEIEGEFYSASTTFTVTEA